MLVVDEDGTRTERESSFPAKRICVCYVLEVRPLFGIPAGLAFGERKLPTSLSTKELFNEVRAVSLPGPLRTGIVCANDAPRTQKT
eukprot:scaffold31414_cov183-Amphora_coffeaeformis.AAC.7